MVPGENDMQGAVADIGGIHSCESFGQAGSRIVEEGEARLGRQSQGRQQAAGART